MPGSHHLTGLQEARRDQAPFQDDRLRLFQEISQCFSGHIPGGGSHQLRLPDVILDRRKVGFNLPVSPWLKRGMKPFVMDTLSPRRVRDTGLLDPGTVQTLLDQHFAGKADNSHQVWCLLTLVLWYEKFMTARRA